MFPLGLQPATRTGLFTTEIEFKGVAMLVPPRTEFPQRYPAREGKRIGFLNKFCNSVFGGTKLPVRGCVFHDNNPEKVVPKHD